MKAAVIKSPGEIVVEEVPTPSPSAGEVLLKVDACALCGTDQRVLKGEKHVDVPIVGHEIVGTVAGVGDGVADIKEGERYTVQTVIGCNECAMCKRDKQNLCEKGFTAMGYQYSGGFAEYMIMPKVAVDQGNLIPVSDSLSAVHGTIIEPLSCCVNGMSFIPLETVDHVVIFGGGIIGVLNGLVAKARGAKEVTVMDVSQERLQLHQDIGLPFDNWVNSAEVDPVEWVKEKTGGMGVDVAVVAASVTQLVPQALEMVGHAGHLSIFAGMPKSNPVMPIDLNKIHYLELHVHGANSSVKNHYIDARDMIESGKIDPDPLVTHTFSLDDFNEAVAIQADPSAGSMKIVIEP